MYDFELQELEILCNASNPSAEVINKIQNQTLKLIGLYKGSQETIVDSLTEVERLEERISELEEENIVLVTDFNQSAAYIGSLERDLENLQERFNELEYELSNTR